MLLLLFWVAFRGYERRIEAGAQRELMLVRISEERFRSLVQNAADVLVIADGDARMHYVSPAVERNWGHAPGALADMSLFTLVHPEDLDGARAFYAECVRSSGTNIATQLRVRAADGSWRDAEVIGNNMLGDDAVDGVVLTLHDITERKSFEAQLTKLAFRDSLTNLANRALFADRLEQALARAKRRMGSVGVLFLDLDDFKDVNDRLGHAAGDRLLVIVAERLRQVLRGADTAARVGGDEFTVLLEEIAGEDAAVEIADRIAETLAEPFTLDGHELFITASIGIAVSGPAAELPESLLRKADLAMYRAKSDGKARHQTFEPVMEARAMERIELDADLRHALARDEFRVVYQPIVSLDDGCLVGVEALVRWDHPTRGVVMPVDFIPFAEETGLIVPIGLSVLQDACTQAAAWNHDASRNPIGVSVNLSARQFQHLGLVDDIGSTLRDSGLDPAMLTLEITESDVMRDPLVAADRLREIKSIGVKIAVDDFGTGYSSLAYLKNFPVDSLKIDRGFISGVGVDKDDSAIVRSVVALGHALDLSVTGEGIETAAQRDYLIDLGCDLGQGYLFDRPLPAAAIEAAITRHGRTSLGVHNDRRAPKAS